MEESQTIKPTLKGVPLQFKGNIFQILFMLGYNINIFHIWYFDIAIGGTGSDDIANLGVGE